MKSMCPETDPPYSRPSTWPRKGRKFCWQTGFIPVEAYPTLNNCTITGNTATLGGGIFSLGDSASPVLKDSITEPNASGILYNYPENDFSLPSSDLDGEARPKNSIYDMGADEYIPQELCPVLSDDLTLAFHCVRFRSHYYAFTLHFSSGQTGSMGLRWKMDETSFMGVDEKAGDPMEMSEAIGIRVDCLNYKGTGYAFILDYTPIPDDPAGLYWTMDVDSFTILDGH